MSLSMNRLRAAFRTNEPQATSVVMFTALNLLACIKRDGHTPWWFWLGAGTFWVILAFVSNLIDPIPDPNR